MSTCLSFMVQFGIFLFGAYLAICGEITPGTVLIMVNLCGLLLSPIQTVPQNWAARKAALAREAGFAGAVIPGSSAL